MERLINKEEFENVCKTAFDNYINTVFSEESEQELWFRIFQQTCHFFDRGVYNESGLPPSIVLWKSDLTTLLSNRKSESFDHIEIASKYISKMMSDGSVN